MMSSKRKYVLVVLSSVSIVIILQVLDYWHILPLSPLFMSILRWAAIAMIIGYAILRKSLTTWILISMLIGAEFGYDFPAVASHLNIVSKIFLRMIKTIIAPLLFATLVYGIAGHANLKQVGRLGWKSLVYFEIVSTIALFIGLAAINISRAGVGVNFQPSQPAENRYKKSRP